MTWSAWVPAIITLIGWIFVAGQTAGRIKDHETTLGEHHEWLKLHDTKIETQGNSIVRLEAWRDGYNAGRTRTRDEEGR